jgi:hypothetical protein
MPSEASQNADHLDPLPEHPQDEKPRQNASESGSEPGFDQASTKKMLEDAKKSLEYHVAGRQVTVRVQDTLLTFKRWGLRKKMSLGSRVVSLIQGISAIISPEDLIAGKVNQMSVLAVLHHVSDQVIELLAASLVEPFKSAAEAELWIDDNCELNDLFNMGVIVFDQNFGGEEGLGKSRSEVEKLTESLQSLLKR